MHIKKTISLNHEAWTKVRVERERDRKKERGNWVRQKEIGMDGY